MAQIYIAADNDAVGTAKASAAVYAHKLGGYVSPTVEDGITDWNDYHQRYGADKTLSELMEVAQ